MATEDSWSGNDTWASLKRNLNLAWLAENMKPPISRAAVAAWTRVPAERVLEVERLTGVSRERLRPDLYPRPDPADPADPWSAL